MTGVDRDTLVGLGVATLHEAAGRRGLLEGVRLMVGGPFAARAWTTSLPSGDNLGIHLAMRDIPPGAALCVASRGGGLYGVVGDLLVELARARGVAALVIDDGIRDLALLAEPPAVAARAVSPRGTIKQRALSVGAPCGIGRCLVRPGDWVVGDGDGVVVLPQERAGEIVEAARAREAKEEGLRAGARRGEPLLR
jgi:4-hydroxy-4-methyl-2-oxoglutarate aldolase